MSITGNVILSVSTGIIFCSRLALVFISVSTHFLSMCMIDGMWRVDGMGKIDDCLHNFGGEFYLETVFFFDDRKEVREYY